MTPITFVIGKSVRIRSAFGPDECARLLRARIIPWSRYDAKGPWGWLKGRWVCIWSENNRNSPMLIARLSADGAGTLIRGRAGPDLNGTPVFLILTGIMAKLYWDGTMSVSGDWHSWLLPVLLVAALVMHVRRRHDADQLADFIAQTLKAPVYEVDGQERRYPSG